MAQQPDNNKNESSESNSLTLGGFNMENMQERITELEERFSNMKSSADKVFKQSPMSFIAGAAAVGVVAGLLLKRQKKSLF